MSRHCRPSRTGTAMLAAVAAFILLPTAGAPQVPAEPMLFGRVLVGDSAMTSGVVVLHRVSMDTLMTGDVDSVSVATDGSFDFRMPRVPDPATQEMYFASVRYAGVTYFGDAITAPVDLDSLYVIQAYDTVVAPPEGVDVRVAQRMVIFQDVGSGYAIFDVFILMNDGARTIVPSPEGLVWRYPLPEGVRNVMAEQEMAANAVTREGDDIVLRAAVPPGERAVAVRYELDSLDVPIPTPGETEVIAVLVEEPAPAITVEGLTQDEDFLDATGARYRQFIGADVTLPSIRVSLAEESAPPPVRWIAVVLALVLAGGGLLALRGGRKEAPTPSAGQQRQAILLEIARLDEAYETEASPSSARTREYKRRRAELMGRLRR